MPEREYGVPPTDRDRILADLTARANDPKFAAETAEALEASRVAAAKRREREALTGRPETPSDAELSRLELRDRVRVATIASGRVGDDR